MKNNRCKSKFSCCKRGNSAETNAEKICTVKILAAFKGNLMHLSCNKMSQGELLASKFFKSRARAN